MKKSSTKKVVKKKIVKKPSRKKVSTTPEIRVTLERRQEQDHMKVFDMTASDSHKSKGWLNRLLDWINGA